MPQIKKRKMGLRLTVLAAAALAGLALSGVAAGSAQAASWHIKGEPTTETREFGSGSFPGNLTMEVPGRNAKIHCGRTNPIGYIYGGTKVHYTTTISECTVETLSKGELEKNCIQAKPFSLTYDGTGESVTSSETAYLEFESEKGCVLPLKNKITLPSLALSYGPERSFLEVTAQGSGTFGVFSMTTTIHHYWLLLVQGPVWGWS